MARKFIDLDEAAKMVGVTPDALNELRERREIYGYRDGGNWKFKQEDIDKLIANRATADEEGDFAEMDEDPDSILLSEVELGQSGESTSSTIIGGRASKDAADSDIQLAKPAEPSKPKTPAPKAKPPAPADSGLGLAPESDILGGDDDFQLKQPSHDSDLQLDSALSSDIQGGSDVLSAGSGVSPMFDDLDALDLDMDSAADSGIHSAVAPGDDALELPKEAGSDITLGSDALSLEEGSGLALGGEDELALGEASGLELTSSGDAGSAIDLGGDEDDDLVLGGSSHGDLSRSGDSGISLLDPADSGLSLESPPLQLGGSKVESLELGEDDMLLEQPAAAKSGIGGLSDIGGEEQSDDDFLLTPLEEAGVEESDSGSQVIALDSEVEFDEAGAGVASLEGDEGGLGGGMLEEDLGEGLGSAAALGDAALAPAAGRAAATAGAAGAFAAPEPAYSGWNVVSLIFCALLLMLSGMLMYDLMRNMWSWSGPYSVNSSMMDMVLSWFEK